MHNFKVQISSKIIIGEKKKKEKNHEDSDPAECYNIGSVCYLSSVASSFHSHNFCFTR